MCYNGKYVRLKRLFKSEPPRVVIVPLDDSLLAGPEGGLRNLSAKVDQIISGKPDAVMGFPGLFKKYFERLVGTCCILNVTASSIRGFHTRKVLVSTVEYAVMMGLDAVGVHVNISSRYEPEMLKAFGRIAQECERYGMPLMGIMYPRKEKKGTDYNYLELQKEAPKKYAELVRHAARIGVELGADLIKTVFTGSAESFSSVIECSSGVPIVIAGGPKIEAQTMLTNAFEAIQAGAAGVSFGRNVFHRDDSTKYISALRMIVHHGSTVEHAMDANGIRVNVV